MIWTEGREVKWTEEWEVMWTEGREVIWTEEWEVMWTEGREVMWTEWERSGVGQKGRK